MRTYEEHLSAVRAVVTAPNVVTRSLLEADGMVLAKSINATYNSPRFDNSQMDGYAITDPAGGTLTVGATVAAGDTSATPLKEGIATPIMTGAKVPEGTKAIVPVEFCEPSTFVEQGGTVTIPAVKEGQYIRKAGSDVEEGKLLIPGGTRLLPAAISALAGQGYTEVEVYAPARIVVVTGGAEIGTANLSAGQIPDSNGPMIAALCKEYGIEVVAYVRTNDDPGILRSDLEGVVRLYQPDAIVTSGGVSHGKFEVVRQVFEDNGWFGHVAQQPGGPQGLAHLGNVPVICLPGNPVSTLVSFRLYVGPVLGHSRPPYISRIMQDVDGLESRDQFRRGVLSHSPEGMGQAELLPGAGSHLISQAMAATALIRIPAGAHLKAGDPVEVFPI
ncbi:molybdopterin molybdotransferase MoeA [Corynebacterium phoceense]|uniref:molybdopterin molybdotransferase MoeA n=1 Tax=Corynebacterium phoceense TaxID=1686286 RepID=UPI00211C86F7|nr:gephyrin-like molybdotransferase Glp [Corynebacterium phoceense]MCQ9335926.1 molybdopterin molybdotransferase MoeA [Corynebacterium phoceense]